MTKTNSIIIALDGFSSCGKSTLAKRLASHYNFLYIDTGAMYRCVTKYFIENNVDLNQEEEILSSLAKINIEFELLEGNQIVKLNNEDVTEEIRHPIVSSLVSEVAAISKVRKKLVTQQRQYGLQQSVVMDGRDIGTVVFPNADIKLFLTASEEIRAYRRFKELTEKGVEITMEEVLDNLHKRDFIDSTRADSPLMQAEDAIIIDNTDLDRDEQFNLACQIIDRK